MTTQFIFSIILLLVNFIIGLIVLTRKKKDIISKLFLLIIFSIILWTASNLILDFIRDQYFVLFAAKGAYVGAVLIAYSFLYFVLVFPKEEYQISKKIKIFILSCASIFILLSITNLLVKGVEIFSWGINIIPGLFYPFFMFYFVGFMAVALLILIRKLYTEKGVERLQVLYLFIGVILATIGGSLTNLIIPYFTEDFSISTYGPLFTIFFVGFTAFAILKHNLFNIKVIATELLVFAIWVAILFELLLEETLKERLFMAGLFVFTIIAGILLIRSVLREVEQKEQLEKLSKELKVINEKLVETDKMKSAMYSFVSHQIKAPISIIKGFAQLILDNSYGEINDKVRETVKLMKTSSDRLIGLTSDFLDLRRIEEGRMEYEFKEINIVDLVKNVFEELKLLASQKKLEFTLECAEEKIIVKADEQRLRQVILNLIENSVKYTPSGFVKVGLTTNDKRLTAKGVLFTVNDSGIGIRPEVLPELFDQFKRAKEARNIQGTGLGLYVAKEIVKAHNGEIWAESDGENKGSRFYVKLLIG
ncbi:MAG: HATPase domain-containing multisensor signal transduction histidine kinase [Candidatus Wolfebacteria bacterium GW2011_GWC1_37_10]|uniref:histidine kinase n=1 Tax=Candidatus Wolfebacteria bacterium GW2011_GWC1_37_10 TaxID=1619010 RepID=A0A0G0FYR5_9BACT|nr:MAG: HATPase domain-containing multisensor signal transduction histidine kinase [Candidatus Wolfebacteria bacterium GW2011_GWC1_37_10]